MSSKSMKQPKKPSRLVRTNKSPYFLEIETYRFRGHSMGDPERYRTSEEVKCWQNEEDPIGMYHKYLVDNKIASPEELNGLGRAAEQEVQKQCNLLKAVPSHWLRIYIKIYMFKRTS